MAEPTSDQAFVQALHHHQAGQLSQAEALYRSILAAAPDHAEALHHLGIIALQTGQLGVAVEMMGRALQHDPRLAAAHSNLATALIRLGKVEEALTSLRRALALQPDFPDALGNLGAALVQLRRFEEAEPVLRRALSLQARFPQAQMQLALVLAHTGRFDEALAALHRLIAQQPLHAPAHNLLGNVFSSQGKHDQACQAYQKALALQPGYYEAQANLGNVLKTIGRLDEAKAHYLSVLKADPNHSGVRNNLALIYSDQGLIDEAVTEFRKAIECAPQVPAMYANLAGVLNNAGAYEEGFALYSKALELDPQFRSARSNRLMMSLYLPDGDAQEIAAAHREWACLHAEPLFPAELRYLNRPDPERKLRIGYVSPDFRDHPVGRLFLPLLEHHDPKRFELVAYAHAVKPDKLTSRIKAKFAIWRNILGLTDAQVAEKIRADKIDILVDLAGHTAENRLLVFARKPAPIQATYLGYPDTTGMRAIDYRFSDSFADPPGLTEELCVEELVRLDPCAWCVMPFAEVAPLPVGERPITFGCFNTTAKVTDVMLRVWARILHAVPDSRLLLKAVGWNGSLARQRAIAVLGAEGIAPERIDIRGPVPRVEDHLAMHGLMDVALDTFPYHGTNMTFEALWMGIPIVTLAGKTHVSRVGVSLLTNVGHPEWIAHDVDEYVAKAVELAGNGPSRAQLRASLRNELRASPLMDGAAMATRIEAAYRQIWQRWCATAARA